jgi:hypothetical protein
LAILFRLFGLFGSKDAYNYLAFQSFDNVY